jgi:hypothetical protein
MKMLSAALTDAVVRMAAGEKCGCGREHHPTDVEVAIATKRLSVTAICPGCHQTYLEIESH